MHGFSPYQPPCPSAILVGTPGAGDPIDVPGPDIDVRNAILSAAGTSEPIPILQTDLQHTIQPLGLVPVT